MIAALLTLAIAQLSAGERTPLPMIIIAPPSESSASSTLEIARELTRAIERRTGYRVSLIDDQGALECRGRISCIVPRLRGEAQNAPLQLLVASVLGSERDSQLLSLLLIDVEAAEKARAAATGDELAIEAAVLERAIDRQLVGIEVGDQTMIARVCERAIDEGLQPAFVRKDVWEPFGAVVISGGGGLSVSIDDRSLGMILAHEGRIVEVRPGKRIIALVRDGVEVMRAELLVSRGAHTKLDVVVPEAPDPLWDPRFSIAGGGLVASAGAAVIVVAALRHQSSLRSLCFEDRSTCPRDQFESTGFEPERAPGNARTINPPGLRIAPLGFGLAVAGLGIVAGALFLDEGSPWAELASLALGALTYGLSVTLD